MSDKVDNNELSTETPKTVRKSPSKPRKKEFTLNDIKKQAKKLNTLSEYVLDKESNTIIKYYETFDEKKIRELLLELNAHGQYDIENKIGFFDNDGAVLQYLEFLMVKYFTKIHETLGSDFEENKEAFDELDSTGITWLFHNVIFDNEQIAKVYERFYERLEIMDKVIQLDPELQEKLANLQNKDILFKQNKIIPEA